MTRFKLSWLFNSIRINATLGKQRCKAPRFKDLKHSLLNITQFRLIYRIIKYCNEMVDEHGNKRLDYKFPQYRDRILRRKDMRILDGLCHGLSNMFLFAAFISDVIELENQNNDQDRDDLSWFYECIYLLHSKLDFNKFTPRQHDQVVRFIALVRFFQNGSDNGRNYNLDCNQFLRLAGLEDPTWREHINHLTGYQSNHADNVEFTGKNIISFDAEYQAESMVNFKCESLKSLLERSGPFYVRIFFIFEQTLKVNGLSYAWRSGHMVSLHKDNNGNFTYFDPNHGFRDIQLNTEEQLEIFKRQLKKQYPNIQKLFFKIGIIKRNEKNNLSLA